MRGPRFFLTFLACIFLPAFLHADCIKDQDHRSDKNSGILVTDFTISGTQSINSSDLARMTSQLAGSCFDEDSEEMEDRVRALFQNLGYFAAEVKALHIKPADPLAHPKTVTLEAEVFEGLKYKLAQIDFTGNHFFTTPQLRHEFPLKKGDLFERNKIAAGIDSLRTLYGSEGFLDWTLVPETQAQPNATMSLNSIVEEGPQYHMGKLEILAQTELADKLRAEWQLSEGAIFDSGYVDQYLDASRSLLPSGFTRDNNLRLVRNCPDATVEVMLLLGGMAQASPSTSKSVECNIHTITANNALDSLIRLHLEQS